MAYIWAKQWESNTHILQVERVEGKHFNFILYTPFQHIFPTQTYKVKVEEVDDIRYVL